MKKILLIATGGTIASRPSENGMIPLIASEEILQFVPEIKALAQVDAIQLFNIDSSNMYCKHWIDIARCIKDNYDKYDGFVVTHGTDTMAYTAAAISYLVQNSKKPIVFTGSQKSIYMRDTDARNNLYNAFVFAVDDSASLVHIVFEDKIIDGNRARKIRTKSYNAFQSVDFPEIGIIRDGKFLRYIYEEVTGDVQFSFVINNKVFVLKLIPGIDFSVLNSIAEKYDAIVLESFGVGNFPLYDMDNFEDNVSRLISLGKIIVVTTQVPHEGSDMSIYETGKIVKSRYNVIEAYNMTLESLITKLMWILGQTKSPKEVIKLFYKKVQKDII